MSEPGSETEVAARPGFLRLLGSVLTDARGRVAIVFVLASLPLCWAMLAPRVEPNPPPPVLLRVPAFELLDQAGRLLRSSDLQGGPWVGAAFFTRCPTVCPQLMADLRSLELDTRVAAPGGRFVCFTADPAHDDPAVLAAYAREQGLEGERFVLLTGEEALVRKAVIEGLKLGLGEDGEAPFGIFHATSLALVDRQLNVRGYYRADAPGELDQLARDLITLDRLSR